ncbi:MAG TPA: hypothetical protein VGL38_07930 [bacterium]|jgi:hypothetical protein
MNNLEWHLFTIRTQIEMRMQQLDLSREFRSKVVEIISQMTDIPRLSALARRMDAKKKRMPED